MIKVVIAYYLKFGWGNLGARSDSFKVKEPKLLNEEKATVGITALSFLREQIEEKVCDLDVELKFPSGAEAQRVRLFVF